jgi:hypothetical protein
MHSVKNRFLMRLKNSSAGLYRRYWLPMTLRDLLVIGGALLAEPSSLAAFWHLLRCLPRALRARQAIMHRRRIDDATLARWFSFEPMSLPIGEASELRPQPAGADAEVRAGRPHTATTSTISSPQSPKGAKETPQNSSPRSLPPRRSPVLTLTFVFLSVSASQR